MSNLTILNTSIRTLNGLYSLNDLHRAGGGETKHKPSFFIRNDQTQDLIAEIELQICNSTEAQKRSSVKTIHGGINSGTYACEELALAYATWISPKFHLVVLRAFIAMHKGEVKPKQLALPEPEPKTITLKLTETEAKSFINIWMAFTRFREAVYFLLKSLTGLQSKQIDSVRFNHDYLETQIRETHPLIRELISLVNKQTTKKNVKRLTSR